MLSLTEDILARQPLEHVVENFAVSVEFSEVMTDRLVTRTTSERYVLVLRSRGTSALSRTSSDATICFSSDPNVPLVGSILHL